MFLLTNQLVLNRVLMSISVIALSFRLGHGKNERNGLNENVPVHIDYVLKILKILSFSYHRIKFHKNLFLTSSISARDSPFSRRNRRQFGSSESVSVCGNYDNKRKHKRKTRWENRMEILTSKYKNMLQMVLSVYSRVLRLFYV